MKKIIIFMVSVLLLAGCGYTTRSLVTDKYKTIHVGQFINKIEITNDLNKSQKYKIYKPLLETDLTKVLIDRFISDGNLKLSKTESADLVLNGALVDFRKDPLRYDNNDEVLEYRINLVVNLQLWDKRNNQLLWEENNFTGEYSYFTTGNFSISEDAAVSAAMDDLARRIVERTIDQW